MDWEDDGKWKLGENEEERHDWHRKIRWKTVVKIHWALVCIEVTSLLCADWLAVDGPQFLFLTEFGMFCSHFFLVVLILSTATDALEISCILSISLGFPPKILRWLTVWWKRLQYINIKIQKFSHLLVCWNIELGSFQGKLSWNKPWLLRLYEGHSWRNSFNMKLKIRNMILKGVLLHYRQVDLV